MNNMQQQNPFEFMKFIPVQGEKHLGIAIIRYERRFIFRFKIMPSDHGGYWATTASIKTGTANGKDKYEPAFNLDSDYEKSQMTDFVLACVTQELSKANTAPVSAFTQKPTQQPIEQQLYNSAQYKAHTQTNQGASNGTSNGRAYNGNVTVQSQGTIFDDNVPF